MLDDIRFGWRKLRQQPGFTAVAVLTLALGIGATSAVFSLVQGVLLTAIPYRQPHTLALVQPAPTEGRQVNARRWSAAQWTEWQRDAKAFEAFAGYGWSFNFMVLDDVAKLVKKGSTTGKPLTMQSVALMRNES